MVARIVSLLAVVVLSSLLLAQENSRPTFRSETTVVLVPTLVTDEHGEVIYGLTQKDFVIMDNGVERTVLMDDTFSSKPVSLVLAVQTGGSAPAVLGSGCTLLDDGRRVQAIVKVPQHAARDWVDAGDVRGWTRQ